MPNSPVINLAAVTGFSLTFVHSPVIAYAAVSGLSFEPPAPTGVGYVLTATTGFEVTNIVLEGIPASIRAAIQDILSLFGARCCTTPSDCLLAAAINAVNTGQQQFYQSARAHEFLVQAQERRYSFSGSPTAHTANALFSLTGARLPSRNASSEGVTYSRDLQHVAHVTYSAGTSAARRTHHLRPAVANPMGAMYGGVGAGTLPGSGILEWLDADDGTVPLFYEVFRGEDDIAMIRAFPFVTGDEEVDEEETAASFATVTYYESAEPVTALDFSNGAAFDIATPYIELYLMPLCRYAALSSSYIDSKNGPQIEAIKARYAEVLQFLGLADIQPTTVSK